MATHCHQASVRRYDVDESGDRRVAWAGKFDRGDDNVNMAKGKGLQRRLRLGATVLMLVAVAGVQLIGTSTSFASTVTKPALAKSSHGRFLDTIVMDGGIVTVTPAPANVTTARGLGAVTAAIWASAQFSGFAPQTLGYGYVTLRGTATGEKSVKHLLAWVGFANGNTSSVCARNKAGKFRSNGEAAVVFGDPALSAAVAYVPPRCGIAQRQGYTIPSEVVSVPWAKVGEATSKGVVTFRTTVAQCGAVSGSTRARGVVLEVLLYLQRPDWSATTCSANVVSLGMPLATTGAKANALTLVHGRIGPVRQVVAAG